jgi:hypothetical protein
LLLKILGEPTETKQVDQNDGHEAQLVRLDVLMLVKDAKTRLSADNATKLDSLLKKAEQEHLKTFHRPPSENEQGEYNRVAAEVEFA